MSGGLRLLRLLFFSVVLLRLSAELVCMLQRLQLEFNIWLLSKSFDVGLCVQPDNVIEMLNAWSTAWFTARLDPMLASRWLRIFCWLIFGSTFGLRCLGTLKCVSSHAWIELVVEYCIRHWLGRLNLTCSTLELLIVDTVAPYADIESDRAWDKAAYLMTPRKLLPCFLLLALKLGRCSHVCNHDYDALAPQLTSHKVCCFADWKKRLTH